MSTATKDIELGTDKYQLTRFSARDGSWIVSQMITSMLLVDTDKTKPKTDQDYGLFFALSLHELPETTYRRIQELCFGCCRKYAGDAAHPILMADGTGRWTNGEPDLVTATALVTAVLVFNLVPFFEPGALKTMRTIYPDLSTRSATTSTDTSSAQ